MSKIITVKPMPDGWRVSGEPMFATLSFASGAKAEAAARALALDLADLGHAVKIEIWLRDGRLAGRLVCTSGALASRAAA